MITKLKFESILNPLHNTLNPLLWDDRILKTDVKQYIENNFIEWLNNIDDSIGIKDMYFLGSNTGYQYSDTSDIDINVYLNASDDEINKLNPIRPNGNNLPNTNYPINYFLVNKEIDLIGKGAIYDLFNNEWVVEPSKEKVEISLLYIIEIAKIFMEGIDNKFAELVRDEKEREMYIDQLNTGNYDEVEVKREIQRKDREIEADYDSLVVMLHLIHTFRNEGFDDKEKEEFLMKNQRGNFSIQNQIYKIIEKFGYIEKLHGLKTYRDILLKED